MRRNLIAANWKMHFDLETALSVARGMVDSLNSRIETVVCPPFVYLDRLNEIFKGSSIELGAQNMHYEDEGAFTGEISPVMLKSVGCRYVILGHSERRHIFSEGDKDIQRKVLSALKHGLIPILCVGETLSERREGNAHRVVERQIVAALDGVDLDRVVVAYEPVWAIGTGIPADIETLKDMQGFIRELIEDVPILYGGSVKDKNAFELATIDDVDGFLVGSASLKVESFKRIIEEFEKAKGVD